MWGGITGDTCLLKEHEFNNCSNHTENSSENINYNRNKILIDVLNKFQKKDKIKFNKPKIQRTYNSNVPRYSWPPTSVKLWTNRIPKYIDEAYVYSCFVPYGDILEVYIHRDGPGKYNTAFIRISSLAEAMNVVEALHNQFCYPQSKDPIQVRYADGELKRLKLPSSFHPSGEAVKVFVGNLHKNVSENDLSSLISSICPADEIYVIKNTNGKSKGSALLTFSSLGLAKKCIAHFNNKFYPTVGPIELQARYAESKNSNKANKTNHVSNNKKYDNIDIHENKNTKCEAETYSTCSSSIDIFSDDHDKSKSSSVHETPIPYNSILEIQKKSIMNLQNQICSIDNFSSYLNNSYPVNYVNNNNNNMNFPMNAALNTYLQANQINNNNACKCSSLTYDNNRSIEDLIMLVSRCVNQNHSCNDNIEHISNNNNIIVNKFLDELKNSR